MDGIVAGHQTGGDHSQDLALHAGGVADELDGVAHVLGQLAVGGGDPRDALAEDGIGVQTLSEGHGRQDHDLAGCIQSLHVGGGICLGVAQLLGILQYVVKGSALGIHTGEDIVGGTVEDTADGGDVVGCQILAQRTDDGNTAAHRGLKEVGHAHLTGHGQQLGAEVGHDLLVGRHHALARLQASQREIVGGMGAAHHLGHHRHLRVVYDDVEIVNDAVGKGGIGEIPQVKDILDVDRPANLFFNNALILGQNLRGAAADNAEAQESYVDHGKYSFRKSIPLYHTTKLQKLQ